MILYFGKYKGKHIKDVPREYLVWLANKSDPKFKLTKSQKARIMAQITGVPYTEKPYNPEPSDRVKKIIAGDELLMSYGLVKPDTDRFPANKQVQVFIRDWRSQPYEEGDPF